MNIVPPALGGAAPRRAPVLLLHATRSRRAAFAGLLLAGLSACAGEEPLAALAPPHPSVPEVPATSFPSVGTPTPDRTQPLTPEAQQKLQKDLERLSRQQAN